MMETTDENICALFTPITAQGGDELAQEKYNLNDICKQAEFVYALILQQNSRESAIAVSWEYVLAQLYLKLGDLQKAKSCFLHAMPIIETNDCFDEEVIYAAQIPYCRFLYMDNNAVEAMERLEKQLALCKDKPIDDCETYWYMIDLLASIYGVEKEYQKSIDLQCEQLNILMKEHFGKNGNSLTKNNIDFEKPVLNKIISLYLGVGANFSRLGKYWDAKQYLEKGYFISYTKYGDMDERTLKLNYNLAVNECLGFNQSEGIRQLKYVYADLQKYLGDENMYTRMAKSSLEQCGESP